MRTDTHTYMHTRLNTLDSRHSVLTHMIIHLYIQSTCTYMQSTVCTLTHTNTHTDDDPVKHTDAHTCTFMSCTRTHTDAHAFTKCKSWSHSHHTHTITHMFTFTHHEITYVNIYVHTQAYALFHWYIHIHTLQHSDISWLHPYIHASVLLLVQVTYKHVCIILYSFISMSLRHMYAHTSILLHDHAYTQVMHSHVHMHRCPYSYIWSHLYIHAHSPNSCRTSTMMPIQAHTQQYASLHCH